jgi:tetratricopeptide (TPR) repeat protein
MKKEFQSSVLQPYVRCLAVVFLCLTMTATAKAQMGSGQTKPSDQPKPTETPRRPLPKPVAGARGFDQFAKRDASARLIAAAGTRVIVDPDDHFSKGEAHYKAGKYDLAIPELRKAIKSSPDWDDPHYVLALTLTETGDLKGAIKEFKRVIELALKDDPKILSYYNMGNAFADLGEYKDAINAYEEAIKLNPKLSKPHHNLGLAYAASNRLADAANEFTQAVKLKPDYAEAHFNLGVAYLQMGRTQEAKEQQQVLAKLKSELAGKLNALIQK